MAKISEDDIAGRLGDIDRDGERTSSDVVSGAGRSRRDRRPNVRLNLESVEAEKLVRLKRSRSGHQGCLTELYKKIKVLLTDYNNASEVRELLDMINREWERFNFIHDEILACVVKDTSAVEDAQFAFGVQSKRKTEILETVNRYLELCEAQDKRKPDKTGEDDYETRSEVSINESNKLFRSNRSSVKSNVSTRSFDAKLKRQKAELALEQFRRRQDLEKQVEQHRLELQQIVELRKLEDDIELAELEEQFADEYEQNLFDDNELTKINNNNYIIITT